MMHPDVDILLVSYNHERFIDQAIYSIFWQTYPGRKRIIVADDYSTDDTVRKARQRAQERPDIPFSFLPSSRNLGLLGNYVRAFAACQAGYIAILEADDFWIGTEKLAKQIAFLEANPDCVMCGCNYYIICEDAAQAPTLRMPVASGHAKFDARAAIRDNVVSNYSTNVYRRTTIKSLPSTLFDFTASEWIVSICAGIQGSLGFLNEPLSAYRFHSGGAWSKLSLQEKIDAQLAVLAQCDEVTEGRFHDEFDKLRATLEATPLA